MNTNNTALIRSISQGAWFLEPAASQAYMPLAISIMKGEAVEIQERKAAGVSFFRPDATLYNKVLHPESARPATAGSAKQEDEELVAIYPVHGVITKYDQRCGPDGMLTLINNMKAMDKDSRVIAHVLDIDSGGGEASIIDTIAGEINKLSKPVVSYFNSVNASAAYYISAATTEIYASEPTDMVGSIGTMVTFADFKEYYEKEGIKIHEVYADQSSLKNADFKEARDGKYEKIKANMLNPYAEAFISAVKKYRPQLEDKNAFKGEIYTAKQAVANGMIDGIKSFSEVIQRATELGRSGKTSTNPQNTTKMDFQNIQSTLGYEDGIEIKDGHASFSVEDMQKIEAAIPAQTTEAPEAPAQEKKAPTAEADTAMTAIEAKMDQMMNVIQAQQAAIAQISGKAAPSATGITAGKELPDNSGSDDPVVSAQKALDDFNQTALQVAQSGNHAYV